MRFKAVFLSACGMMVALPLAGQAAGPEVPGFLSLRQGTFRPLLRAVTPPAGVPATGTVQVTYTISIVSSIVNADGLSCSADATSYTTAGNYFDVSATAAAVRSGATATCTVTMPYSWPGISTTDTISVTYTLYDRLQQHQSLGSLGTFAVPANGTTTKLTLATVF